MPVAKRVCHHDDNDKRGLDPVRPRKSNLTREDCVKRTSVDYFDRWSQKGGAAATAIGLYVRVPSHLDI